MLVAEPLIRPGDVDDVGQGKARNKGTKVYERVALHGEHLPAENDRGLRFRNWDNLLQNFAQVR